MGGSRKLARPCAPNYIKMRTHTLLFFLAYATAHAQFTYITNNDGTIAIRQYTGPGGAVTIPSFVRRIASSAFANTSVSSVTIPTNVTLIGHAAFYSCTNLTGISVDALNQFYSSVDGALFDSSQATLIQFPPAKLVNNYAVPSSVTRIGYGAFSSCSNLTNVTINESVESIDIFAFIRCSKLSSVRIPESVTSIGIHAFLYCANLKEIVVGTNNPAYTSDDGILFDQARTRLIECPGGKTGNYVIPDSVASIANGAFCGAGLNSVTIDNSVSDIGTETFFGCYNLTSVTIGSGITKIGDYTFYLCSSLTNVLIPDNVTSIGGLAFGYCSNLRNITIPDGVTSIGYAAFECCGNLTSLRIPNGIARIEDGFCFACSSLTNVTLPKSCTYIGVNAFVNCNLASVVIPIGVTSVGDYAFFGNTGITAIYFQGNPPTFGPFTFYGDNGAIVYYLLGTTDWGSTYAGLPTALWNPTIQTADVGFGMQSNQFGFSISGTTNIPIVVEASTNLASGEWTFLQAFTITNGSVHFRDPQRTIYLRRFYRIRSP